MPEKPLNNISVLLVEDNEMNTLLASAILGRTGASITGTDNGKEAIRLLKEKKFDVVLMDLHLPVMNGFETTRQIREDLSLTIPIIAITANVINDEEVRCLKAGMNAFITKPYNEQELIDKILICTATIDKKNNTGTSLVEESLYDLSMLKKLANGNRDLLSGMLNAFIKQVPISIKELKTAIQERNYEQIYLTAHNIKPNIDTLEITSLKQIIRQIESFALDKGNANELELLISTFESSLIKKILPSLSKHT